jgi:hypothetical protein
MIVYYGERDVDDESNLIIDRLFSTKNFRKPKRSKSDPKKVKLPQDEVSTNLEGNDIQLDGVNISFSKAEFSQRNSNKKHSTKGIGLRQLQLYFKDLGPEEKKYTIRKRQSSLEKIEEYKDTVNNLDFDSPQKDDSPITNNEDFGGGILSELKSKLIYFKIFRT